MFHVVSRSARLLEKPNEFWVDLLRRTMLGRTQIRQSRPDIRQSMPGTRQSTPDVQQSWPDSCLGFQVQVPNLFYFVSSSARLLEKPKELWVDLVRRTMLERTHLRQSRPDTGQSRPDIRQSRPHIRQSRPDSGPGSQVQVPVSSGKGLKRRRCRWVTYPESYITKHPTYTKIILCPGRRSCSRNPRSFGWICCGARCVGEHT